MREIVLLCHYIKYLVLTKSEEKVMITIIIFAILLIAVCIKLCVWGIKAAWGITKVLLTLLVFPMVLIALFCSGMVWLVFIILGIVAVFSLIASAVA